MSFIGAEYLSPRQLYAALRNYSDTLIAKLRRLESFESQASESAKTILIKALFVEIFLLHPKLKVREEGVLNTDSTT